jgi:hypothetical protein
MQSQLDAVGERGKPLQKATEPWDWVSIAQGGGAANLDSVGGHGHLLERRRGSDY